MGKNSRVKLKNIISQVPNTLWELEFEKSSSRYHVVAAWVAIIFDPLFAITDYYNIPERWQDVLVIRLGVAVITLTAIFIRKRYYLPSYFIVVIPCLLICLQNAYTYSLIGDAHLLGHSLNFMALFIGASMFVVWPWPYSIALVTISAFATAYFMSINPTLNINQFFVKGGLLLIASGAFMTMLIRTRYILTVKEIKARTALQLSNEEIQTQNEEIKAQNQEIQMQGEEIKGINENLENLVRQRTAELEKKKGT